VKVLIVGGNGQLGRALSATAPAGVEIVSHGSKTLDITDSAAVDAEINKLRPQVVLNAAAYTAVDKAEDDPASAQAVNADAVGYLARAARRVDARFVYISTDFVFDGRASTPYLPDAPTAPLSVYGRTKLAGEKAAGADALIVRTAWLYAAQGANFVRTMLHLMAERPEIRVVADQIGTPTYAVDLAAALWTMVREGARGVHHYTDAGVCSWYEFAVAIHENALAAGLLRQPVSITPIGTSSFPTRARRPPYSVLDKHSTYLILGGPTAHWRTNLSKMIDEVKNVG
jgi:dTDP-4-dehydrorhamnose reductase